MTFLLAGLLGFCTPRAHATTDTGWIQNVGGDPSQANLWAGSANLSNWSNTLMSTIGAGWTWTCSNCSNTTSGTVTSASWNGNDWVYVILNVQAEPGMTYDFFPPPPPLCCGGSAAPFNANSTYVSSVQNFATRATNDSKVYVDQVGSFNNAVIQQTGTKDNYVSYVANGDHNNVNINQSASTPTALNYIDLHVVGSTNNVNLTQTSTGGSKGAFVTVNDNNNNVNLLQQDGGNKYADILVSGGNKNVDITQTGAGSHMATVALTGPQPASLNLQQLGGTQQFYSIQSNCTTPGGCAPITVQQGR
jgi:hypothetical protein